MSNVKYVVNNVAGYFEDPTQNTMVHFDFKIIKEEPEQQSTIIVL